MRTILIQMADDDWTMHAMHLACALARNVEAKIALLRLIHVQHPSYLGTSFGNLPPDNQEYQHLQEYAATAEDYGVELTVYAMQCMASLDAVAEAAANLDAALVFAQVPSSRVPSWRKFQIWNLERRLRMEHCQLFTLDQLPGTIEWVPSITVKAPAPVK
jgi:hypothetical protein